jgi:hypothetical protein
VALSAFIKPGMVSSVDYSHYSLLRTVEDIFRLSHLGDARMPQVKSFGKDVFTRARAGRRRRGRRGRLAGCSMIVGSFTADSVVF